MSFTKRTIKDRVATGDNKFINSGTSSNLVLTPNPDSVTEAGTSINADLLQRYEDTLYAIGLHIDGGKSNSPDANNDIPNGVFGTKITIRRDTASNWQNNNPTLSVGEIGYDTTNKKIKIGDGSTTWNSLGYVALASQLPTALSDLINDLVNNAELVIKDEDNTILGRFTANASSDVAVVVRRHCIYKHSITFTYTGTDYTFTIVSTSKTKLTNLADLHASFRNADILSFLTSSSNTIYRINVTSFYYSNNDNKYHLSGGRWDEGATEFSLSASVSLSDVVTSI